MKRLFVSAMILLGIGIFSSGLAQTVTLNFDDLEEAGSDLVGIPGYSKHGFIISDTLKMPDAFVYPQQGHDWHYGSANLFYQYTNEWAILSLASNELFTLNSIDLHGLSGGSQTVDFYAYDAGQAQVGHAFLDFDDNTVWHTLNFGPEFQNIASVRWQQADPYHSFDAIVLTPAKVIPEPLSFLLYGLGGLTLAAFHRKKKKEKGRKRDVHLCANPIPC